MMLDELGMERITNAEGTVTLIGGCVVDDEVLKAAAEAAHVFLDMPKLHKNAGAYVAKLLGAEDAYITCGAAAGLTLSAAACLTRGNPVLMMSLPETEDIPNQVIIQRVQRNPYDAALRIAGAKLVEIGDEHTTRRAELEEAINEKTCAVVYFVFDPQDGVLPLDEVIETSHKRGIPVIVDAASEIPPRENLFRFLRMGADLVIFSGGKDIGAPNDTGLVVGTADLIDACRRMGSHGYEVVDSKTRTFIGRPMKVSKEDVFAFVSALKRYLMKDHEERLNEWERKVDLMVETLSSGTMKARKVFPTVLGHPRPCCVPKVEVEIQGGLVTAADVVQELKMLHPPIYTYSVNGKLYLNPQCLGPGEEKIVASELSEVVSAHLAGIRTRQIHDSE